MARALFPEKKLPIPVPAGADDFSHAGCSPQLRTAAFEQRLLDDLTRLPPELGLSVLRLLSEGRPATEQSGAIESAQADVLRALRFKGGIRRRPN